MFLMQPVKIQKVVTPRKPTSEVTRSYGNRRRTLLNDFQKQIHGEDVKEDEGFVATLDVNSALAMSRQMKAPWESLDVVRR